MSKFTQLLIGTFLFLTLSITISQFAFVQGGDQLGAPTGNAEKLEATKQLFLGQSGESVEGAGYNTIASIVEVAIRFLLIGGMVAFMVLVLVSGYKLIANADKERELSSLKTNLTNGVIGLIVLAATWWIVEFFKGALGINIK